MTPRLRYSISPTELPHVNNLHQALMSWAATRALDGDLTLSINDAYINNDDAERLPMLEALAWLNIDWDEGIEYGGEYEPYRQSKKIKRYQQLFDQLYQNGHLQQTGAQTWALSDGGGVLMENGRFQAHFLTIIDNHDTAVSHIIQPLDTQFQNLSTKLHNLLNWQEPTPIELPRLQTNQKKDLPVRGYRLEDLQNQGFLAKAIFNYLAILGWQSPPSEIMDKWQVRTQFTIEQLTAKPTVFDWQQFKQINAHYIQQMGNQQLAEEIRPFLEDAYGAIPMAEGWLERVTNLIKPDLQTLEDAIEVAEWALSDDFELSDAASAQLEQAEAHPILSQTVAELATVVLLDEKTAETIISGIQNRLALNDSQQVTSTLQAALTGQINNLPLSKIMGILGKQTALQRIANTLR